MEIQYREGREDDCQRLAELMNIASGGVLEFLFQDLTPGLTPVQAVARNLRRDKQPYTFRNALVAERDGSILGMALSYASRYHGVTDGMRGFFPADRLKVLEDFYASRVEESLYLDTIAVDAASRSHGVGRQLIALVKERAMEKGLESVSLIAFADNIRALRLYERLGFQVVKRIRLEADERIPHEGGCLLLNSAIALDSGSPSAFLP